MPMIVGGSSFTSEELEFLILNVPYEPSELPPLVSGLFYHGFIERSDKKWILTLEGLQIKLAWALKTDNQPLYKRITQEIDSYERPKQ